jgi:hypothetical protein
MNYKILINGKEIGVFGHDEIKNIHLSVSGEPNDMYVFASAVCKEGDKTYNYHWLQQTIGPKDKVEIVPTRSKRVREPLNKFLMGRPTHEPSEDKSCDFCQRKETEVKKLIFIDEHRPSICSDCVDLCNEILKDDV